MTPDEVRKAIADGSVETDIDKQLFAMSLARKRITNPDLVYRVEREGRYGLTAVCENGEKTSFSWLRAMGIGGKEIDHIGLVQKAARFEIQDQIDDYRKAARFGEHVGHVGAKEFRHLLTDFLERENALVSIESVKVRRAGTTYSTTFEDRDLANRWKEYHRTNAVLGMQKAKVNLSAAKSPTLRAAIARSTKGKLRCYAMGEEILRRAKK